MRRVRKRIKQVAQRINSIVYIFLDDESRHFKDGFQFQRGGGPFARLNARPERQALSQWYFQLQALLPIEVQPKETIECT